MSSIERRRSGRLQAAALPQLAAALTPGAGAGIGNAAPLPGVGGGLLNMPLQEQLRMLQQHALLGAQGQHAVPATPDAAASPGRSAKKAAKGSVARASMREPTKGVATSSNKPLSSKFRGVCWNRKNKRWQAAINSSGKYLYLGSYIDEDEAAMAFDRAAIKLRGRKAKLNFTYEDYVDGQGNLKEDIQLPEGKGGAGGAAGGRGKKRKGGPDDGGMHGATPPPDGMVLPVVGGMPTMGGPGAAAAAAGGIGGIFSSTLANLSMAEVKRFFGGGNGGGGGGGSGINAAAAAAAAAAPDRGVTTGFTGALPPQGLSAAAAAAAGLSAFAVPGVGGALGPDLALHLPPLDVGGAQTNWQDLLRQFRPALEQELGSGRSITQFVGATPALDVAHDAAGAAAGALGSPGGGLAGLVYAEPAAGGGAPTYGAAVWDGARVMDAGTKGSLEAALETAQSLAAGEEVLGETALRDALGGNSLVPRATSLALFQALGSFRPGDLAALDSFLAADTAGGSGGGAADGAGPSSPKSKRLKASASLGGKGKGGKGRGKQQHDAEALFAELAEEAAAPDSGPPAARTRSGSLTGVAALTRGLFRTLSRSFSGRSHGNA